MNFVLQTLEIEILDVSTEPVFWAQLSKAFTPTDDAAIVSSVHLLAPFTTRPGVSCRESTAEFLDNFERATNLLGVTDDEGLQRLALTLLSAAPFAASLASANLLRAPDDFKALKKVILSKAAKFDDAASLSASSSEAASLLSGSPASVWSRPTPASAPSAPATSPAPASSVPATSSSGPAHFAPSDPEMKAKDRSERRCYYCHELGHQIGACPKKLAADRKASLRSASGSPPEAHPTIHSRAADVVGATEPRDVVHFKDFRFGSLESGETLRLVFDSGASHSLSSVDYLSAYPGVEIRETDPRRVRMVDGSERQITKVASLDKVKVLHSNENLTLPEIFLFDGHWPRSVLVGRPDIAANELGAHLLR